MSRHSDYLALSAELQRVEGELVGRSGDGGIAVRPTRDGIVVETRTASGAGDLNHSLYIKKEHAKFLAAYIRSLFE